LHSIACAFQQQFHETFSGEIIASGTKFCLEAASSSIRVVKCEGSGGLQAWTFLNTDVNVSAA